jgi:uncharacterized membrane protein
MKDIIPIILAIILGAIIGFAIPSKYALISLREYFDSTQQLITDCENASNKKCKLIAVTKTE